MRDSGMLGVNLQGHLAFKLAGARAVRVGKDAKLATCFASLLAVGILRSGEGCERGERGVRAL